jgi:hypothetical protein
LDVKERFKGLRVQRFKGKDKVKGKKEIKNNYG